MIWAIVENEKTEAIPKTKGTCPLCKGKVFSKCGEVNVWHWAHFRGENCDHWYEPETFWHLHWKMTFGKKNSEIIIIKNGKRHIADILTEESVVIELQNSPIQKPIIREREEFYGERMMWLINGIHFKNNINFQETDDGYEWWMDRPMKTEKEKRKRSFTWKYARRSWEEVQRPVFIDFGEETLFRVNKGMGTSRGGGIYVSKEKFIKKYGGDYEYYCQKNLNSINTAV